MIDCSKTENYFAEKRRMTKRTKNGLCKTKCSDCPLCSDNNGTSEDMSCTTFETYYPEKAVKVVQRWSNEHPQKTFVTEFLKNYPRAVVNGDGIPNSVCPYDLGLMNKHDCRKTCIECWNQPIPIEDGEER
jgi:hypothetical protein|nr:hypothetical protein [Ruminococcus bromii]